MTDLVWNKLLVETFKTCRAFPFWCDVYSLHDDEDKGYFDMLESLKGRNVIKIEKHEE